MLQSAGDEISKLLIIQSLVSELKTLTKGSADFDLLLRVLSRLRRTAQYDDVRSLIDKSFAELGVSVNFVAPSRFDVFSCQNVSWPGLSALVMLGRVSNLALVLSSYPSFVRHFSKTLDTIMHAEGPFPLPWRNYIAMMAASRYSCEYLVLHQLERFLFNGGDPSWILSSNQVPVKLRSLSIINSTLAHQPWLLESSHIEKLISVGGRWSSSELSQALCILSTFHCLPSFVFSTGINLEEDYLSCSRPSLLIREEPLWDPTDPLPKCFPDPLRTNIISRLAALNQQQHFSFSSSPFSSTATNCPSPMTNLDLSDFSAFDGFGVLSSEGGAGAGAGLRSGQQQLLPRSGRAMVMSEKEKIDLHMIMCTSPVWDTPLCKVFREQDENVYEDIRVKEERVLHSVNFNWDDHGLVVLSKFFPAAAEAINDEYRDAIDYTNGQIGNTRIDTRPAREALLKYSQRMYGVYHDDYQYDHLNKVLSVMHKVFIKKVACFPERLTRADYRRIREYESFSADDMVHYGYIVFEARRIVELTFALKAIVRLQATAGASGT